MNKIKKFSPLIFIAFLAVILIGIWFQEGLILGTAEAEIPFYKLERFKEITEWAWTDSNLGNSASLTIASGPTWWVLSQIQIMGIPGFVIQAFTFWFLFLSAGLGIYWLTKILFNNLDKKYLILAVLFYYFNPISLVNVWNRFLYNYMFFWALLPIALFLFIKGLKERRYIFSLILALVLTLFSYALTGYVFNALLWLVLIFALFFFIFIHFEKKFILFGLNFFILTLAFFAVFNSWWILPTFSYVFSKDTAEELSNFITPAGNLYTLTLLSQKLGNLIDITRFSHFGFYLNEGPKWANSYLSPFLVFMFFSVSSLIFFGTLKLKKYKEGLLLGALLLLGIFLAKGNNPPFGKVFQFFFEKITFLQIFRDPFEKFGFIVALSAAPLFALGVKELTLILKNRFKTLIYLAGFFIVTGVFGYPFFTGLVFTSQTPPNNNYSTGFKVKVPGYYKEADEWLFSQGKNFRFISFPLGDEGMTYKWEKGYQGVEPSVILFSTPGITFNTTIPYYSQIVEKLEKLFFEEENFYKVANLLNVKYIIVRNDVDITERRLRKPESIEAILDKSQKEEKVKKVAQFGKLSIWENLKWKDKTIYSTNDLVAVFPQPKITEIFFPEVRDEVALISSKNITEGKESLAALYPDTSIVYQKKERCYQLIEDFINPKKYFFNVEKESNYRLLLANTGLFSNEASLSAQLKVAIDDKTLQNSPVLIDSSIDYGEVALTAGKHEISIDRPVSPNLVSSGDGVVINTAQGNSQSQFKINDFNPYQRYLINFEYLLKGGQQFIFYFQQNNDLVRDSRISPECLNINIVNQGTSFSNLTQISDIYSPKRSDEAGLLFSVNPVQNTELTVKNISVNRLIESQPVLIRKNSGSVLPQSPITTYTKHNPSKYSVEIKGAQGPFVLVLSELFNSGWEAKFENGTLITDHFLANAYANGWFIEKTGDFNMTLEFALQRLLNIGKLISIVSLLAALLFLSGMLLKKKGI